MSGLAILFDEYDGQQKALAEKLNVSPMAVSHCKRRGLPARWVMRLAERFPHIPLEEFQKDMSGFVSN